MIGEILANAMAAVGRLGDAEFFAALGMAVFGVAAVSLLSALHKGKRPVVRPGIPYERDEAA